MKRRSIFSVILAVLLITTMFSTTAFALTVPTIEWNQSGYPFLELSSTERQTSNGTLVFDGSAYSATNSAFKIRLEKKGAFGSWSTVGTLRTGESGPGSSYHPREGRNVQGKYFKSTWTGL